jgi:hypothetical protein
MPGKISEYTDAGTLDGDEYIEVVDSPGTTPTTKRTSVAAIRAGYVTQTTFDTQGASGRLLTEATSSSYQSGITNTATDLNGLLITFTVASRPVLCRAFLPFVSVSVAGAAVFGQITDNAGTQIAVSAVTPGAAGGPAVLVIEERITTPGTYTRKVQILRYLASGTVSNNFSTGSSTVVSRLSAIEQ